RVACSIRLDAPVCTAANAASAPRSRSPPRGVEPAADAPVERARVAARDELAVLRVAGVVVALLEGAACLGEQGLRRFLVLGAQLRERRHRRPGGGDELEAVAVVEEGVDPRAVAGIRG